MKNEISHDDVTTESQLHSKMASCRIRKLKPSLLCSQSFQDGGSQSVTILSSRLYLTKPKDVFGWNHFLSRVPYCQSVDRRQGLF